MNKVGMDIVLSLPKTVSKAKSFAQRTGLRSMQNIKGTEREIIEGYRAELPHEIWGDSEKLTQWAHKKFTTLTDKNYTSFMLDERVVNRDRNEAVKAWADIIEENPLCQKNPFLKLKILKSIVENLSENNMQLAPIINKQAFQDAVFEIKRTGASFKKTYFRRIRDFDSKLNVKMSEVNENGIRGKWYSVKVPDFAQAERNPGLFSKIKEYISALSQGSNWCTRTPSTVGRDFTGSDFHIFIDDRGLPQLCLAGTDKNGGWFRFVRGNDQYAPIPQKYKNILKSFLEKNNLDDAQVGTRENNTKHILDLCE